MSERATKTPGIPDIRDDNIIDVLRAIKSTLEVREGRSGDDLDAHVRFRDLSDLNLMDPNGVTKTNDGTIPGGSIIPGGPGSYNPDTDLSIPPAPMNLRVSAGLVAMYLEWDGAPYHNHAYTEVWRSSVDDLSTAIMVGTAIMSMYSDAAEPDTIFYYWVRFHSQANVVGPYNSTSGTQGHTGIDVGKAIEALSGQLVNSPLYTALSQQIAQIKGDAYVANRGLESELHTLSAKVGINTSRLLELNNISGTQATALKILESRGPGNGNAIYFTPERPDAATPGSVNGLALGAGDIWYDTNDSNRSYRWSGTAWIEFVTAGTKVYHQATDPVVSNNGTDWFDSTGRVMREGDIWYDSDSTPTANHPWIWNSVSHTWADISGGDNSAAVITLEQTKIGYATLNVNSPKGLAGSVFDNSGAIWNNVPSGDPDYSHSCQFWNSTHADTPGTDSKVTWHIGLPFAQATKQVGITAHNYDGSTSNITVEQQFTAMQTVDNNIQAQYTVKIDANGYVTGFGLAVNPSTSGPTSSFVVNADRFAIGPAIPGATYGAGTPYNKNDTVKMQQGGTGPIHVFQSRQNANLGHTPVWNATKAETDAWWVDLTARLPFMATTTTQVIDGSTYPPGVWMNAANIADATITNAKIGSLTADKITTGSLSAAVSITTGGYIYGGVNPSQPMASATYGKGFFLGGDGGVIKFYVGNTDLHYAMWDGTNFKVQGGIFGVYGRIGGINMSMSAAAPQAGQLYSDGVTGLNTGVSGFWLDSTAKMRIGNPAGSRMVWDGTNLLIYGASNQLVLGSGGIDWSVIGNVPISVQNTNVGINANGTLVNAGPGQVTATGINAVKTDGSNAPPTILNQTVNLTTGPGGTIKLTGGGTNQIPGIIMPGWQITAANVSTYLESLAVGRAYIALAAIGAAQIENLAVTSAKINDLAVDTLKVAGNAITIPSAAAYASDEFLSGTTEYFLFTGNNNPNVPTLQFALNSVAEMATVMFTTELAQSAGNAGANVVLKCYLSRDGIPGVPTTGFPTGGTLLNVQTFTLGIINNQPRFSQTAAFVFINVPVNDNLCIRFSATYVAGYGSSNNIFGKKVASITCMKK